MSILSPWYVLNPRMIGRRLAAFSRPVAKGTINEVLPFGPKIEFDPARTMGRALYFNGTHELAMAEVAYRLAHGASLAVDAGANIGYVTLAMACALGPKGRCHAFEPVPELYAQLQRNTGGDLNPSLASRIVTHNLALSSADGLATLSIPLSANEGLATLNPVTGSFRTLTVETAALDGRLGGGAELDLLKIDVEGHELSVLRGANQLLLARRIHNIIFEDHVGSQSPVMGFLLGYGFKIFLISYDLLRPRLVPHSLVHRLPRNAACNWLAVLDPEGPLQRMNTFGWRVLGCRR